MTRVLLIRHAENDYVRTGRLAGWTPGVHLNDEGKRQADALGNRLASGKFAAVYSSPLERAVETAEAVITKHPNLKIQIDDRFGEARYGKWTGQKLRQLSRSRLWPLVQFVPSRVRFPDGESIYEVQVRAVAALEQLTALHGDSAILIVSHADVIKVIIAHYAGIHLDLFQRLVIAPASISIIGISGFAPAIFTLNDTHHYDAAKPAKE